jgi:hypothetical protein
MRARKRTVKRLDAEFPRVLFETIRIHQRNRSETPNIGVVKSSAVVELETQRGIAEIRRTETAVVDEQSAGEARLYDNSIAAVEVDHYQLGAAPAFDNRSLTEPPGKRARADFAQYVGFANRDFLDSSSADRAVEIARDRLGLR